MKLPKVFFDLLDVARGVPSYVHDDELNAVIVNCDHYIANTPDPEIRGWLWWEEVGHMRLTEERPSVAHGPVYPLYLIPDTVEPVIKLTPVVTAERVMRLREMTDAPMMECKKALIACQGDMEQATTYLMDSNRRTFGKLITYKRD